MRRLAGVNVPSWLTLGLVGALVGGLFLAAGWIKPYLAGPDLSATIYRPKPAPVEVERVKWLTKVERRTVKERVEVPVEVIRELPAKEARRLEADFGIKLPELAAENRALATVLEVPRAPHGGEMAITVNTETGLVDGIFRAKRARFIQVGGIREAGLEYDPLNQAATGYYRQDLVRIGPAVIGGRVFASAPLQPGGAGADVGAAVSVSIRF